MTPKIDGTGSSKQESSFFCLKNTDWSNTEQISISVTQTACDKKLNSDAHNTQSKLFNDPINNRVIIARKQISPRARYFFVFEKGYKIHETFCKRKCVHYLANYVIFFKFQYTFRTQW